MGFAMLQQKSMPTLLAVVTSFALLAPGFPIVTPYKAAGPCDDGQHDSQIKQRAELWIHHEAIL